MAVTVEMLTTLTSGSTKTTSLMRLALFTRHAVGTTVRGVVPWRCAGPASQERHATSQKSTTPTVSMSLANNPRIPRVTRERIQAVAKRLGYQPNPYLSTLMRIRRQGKPLNDKPASSSVRIRLR